MRFEVRMTAFNRPAMLRRALLSLQAQTYPCWSAVVYDDSTNSDSQAIVEALGDGRIVYQRNPQRLGAVMNVDQCFSPRPVLGGDFGCLLEDDNFWFANCLASVVSSLRKQTWNIIQTNQRLSEEGSGLRPEGQTTRGGWFPVGQVDPIDLRAALLFMEGVSNSGLIWRLGGRTDLRIGDTVKEAGLNEFCRSLVIAEPFLFNQEPQGAYTVIGKIDSARAEDRSRAISRGVQCIRDYVLKVHGRSIVSVARRLAEKHNLIDRLVKSLSYSRHPFWARHGAAGREGAICLALVKGLAIRLVEKDPCAAFLASGRIAAISDREVA
jgi:hypothetical protein